MMSARHFLHRGSSAIAVALLASCGGGGSSPASAPVAAPTPPAPVTPTPPATSAVIMWTAATAVTGDTPIARGVSPTNDGGFYVVGSFRGAMPLLIDGQTVSSAGQEDIFVARISATGGTVWLRRFGGTAGDFAFDVDSDAAGNAYVAGRAAGIVTFGATTIDAGDGDAVLFKVSPVGDVLWVRQTTGPGGSAGNEVATDAAGNAAMVGPAAGPLDLGGGVTTGGPAAGTTDPFVAYYGPDGTPKWARLLVGSDPGSSTTEAARGVTIAPSGKVIMTGPFTGTLAVPGGPTLSSGGASNTDCYLIGFLASGTLDFARSLGGSGSVCRGVGGDTAGGAIVGGTFVGTIFTGANQLVSAGGADIFVVSFAADGAIRWTRRIGGTGGEEGAEVQMLGDDAFVFGNIVGAATVSGGTAVTSVGSRDNVLVRFANDGSVRAQLTSGGAGDDIAFALVVQPDATFAVVGTYSPPSIGFGTVTLSANSQSSFIGLGR